MYSFSADVSCSSSLDVTFRSAARTMPSLARIPMAVPACEMASSAYSTWYRRPSGEKMVVYGFKHRGVSCGWLAAGAPWKEELTRES
jgi:hypothetical protein